jgi:hypothetical protein
MISDILKLEIEAYAQRLRSSDMYRRARRGDLSPRAIAAYVANLRLLIERTHTHLCQARDRSHELGRPALATFFEQRASEELGHEQWADNDMIQLGDLFGTKFFPDRSTAIIALLGYLRKTINLEPALFLAYMILAEYVTVLLGSEWLALLQERCNVPSTAMTVVGNHVDLDREHVLGNLRELDSLVNDQELAEPLLATLEMSMRYFDSFFVEICALCSDHQRVDAFA